MKKIIIIQIAILIGVTSCFREEQCVDNLSAENKKVPYVNGQVVQFQNDTLGCIYDTVLVELRSLRESTYTHSDNEACGAFSALIYSNGMQINIIQQSNFDMNIVGYNFNHCCPIKI